MKFGLKNEIIERINSIFKRYPDVEKAIMAFQLGFIKNGDIWMDMIINRNLTSYTYNEETAKKIVSNIKTKYIFGIYSIRNSA